MEYLNKKILNYTLTNLIGEGGMANVYEGVHERLEKKVAVKVLNPMLSANAQIRARFENEAKIMSSLEHAIIVKVIDYCDQEGTLAIIMELLEGRDLSDTIKANGAIDVNIAIPLFINILDAFIYAHNKGIVHRDIKPANIYIERDGQVKILDFGIAKLFGTGLDKTSTGTQIGTPIYMSPEQVKGERSIDHRSDIYSLGVTFYFMLKGKAPYNSDTESSFEIFNKIVFEPLPELIEYPELNEIIKKAVAKNRNDRFQDVDSFKLALEHSCNEGRPESMDEDTERKTKSNKGQNGGGSQSVKSKNTTVGKGFTRVSYKTKIGTIVFEKKYIYSISVGDSAFLNGKPAPAGKYKIGFLWFVKIQYAVITNISMF